MWKTWINFQRGSFNDLGRQKTGGDDRDNLIGITVEDERRHIELLEILGKVRFGESLDAIEGSFVAAQHPLKPERILYALRDLGAWPVVAVKRIAEFPEELRPIG